LAEKNNISVTRIAVFASGSGTNAKNIIEFFKPISDIDVDVIVCNKTGAGVINIAEENSIPVVMIDRASLQDTSNLVSELQKRKINLIVMAGFLWQLPESLVKTYQGKILNIHPALLPKYGGKGMYGKFVHEAVLENKEKESGITIHLADEFYDKGEIIFQATCDVDETDSIESLAKKIQLLEHLHYPDVIEKFIRKQNHS
jgi:formyltetrahydrofolate-dependent phosphoribosylglycinamide formyltransferase